MKLLLDTTYILPVIGVSVKGISRDILIKLIYEGNQVFLSYISIFELLAKAGKYVSMGKLSPENVVRGVKSILYDDRITIIPMYDEREILLAFRFRKMVNDFIDCLILSSALIWCDILLTEDRMILDLRKDRRFNELCREVNPGFNMMCISEYQCHV